MWCSRRASAWMRRGIEVSGQESPDGKLSGDSVTSNIAHLGYVRVIGTLLGHEQVYELYLLPTTHAVLLGWRFFGGCPSLRVELCL